MKIFTVQEMKKVDMIAAKKYSLAQIVLMENAGEAVSVVAQDMLEDVCDKNIMIFAGKGNNAGDGFSAARKLENLGANVQLVLVEKTIAIKNEAKAMYLAATHGKMEILSNEVFVDKKILTRITKEAQKADLLIDALLGTGFKGELKGNYAKAAVIINSAKKPILAIDVPTGIDADTGMACKDTIKATKTVTMIAPKVGMLLCPGAECCGEIFVADIGTPESLLQEVSSNKYYLTPELVASMLPKRAKNSHKGKNGRIGIIAGSKQYTGAATLAATGALHSGGGLITLFAPECVRGILQKKLTEVMIQGVENSSQGGLAVEGAKFILKKTSSSDVLALGPGLGSEQATKEAIITILKETNKLLVIDADGLNALAEHMSLIRKIKNTKVLTPHYGEMSRLCKVSIEEIEKDPISVAKTFAKKWNAIVVLKGAPTIIASPDGKVAFNSTGNPGMATGGCGDVLTGVIAAFMGQGLDAFTAALCGVFVHGAAGDFVASEKGTIGLTASDLAKKLPNVINSL